MEFINVEKVIQVFEALPLSVVSEIIRLFRSDKNESPVNLRIFRLKYFLRTVRSASDNISRYSRLNEYPVQNEYRLFSGSFLCGFEAEHRKHKTNRKRIIYTKRIETVFPFVFKTNHQFSLNWTSKIILFFSNFTHRMNMIKSRSKVFIDGT
jgi:hypothetical protein